MKTKAIIVIDEGADWERRGRIGPDGAVIELWRREELFDLPAEAIADLHALIEQRGAEPKP